MYHKIKYEFIPNQILPTNTLTMINSHLKLVQSVNKTTQVLKVTNIVVNIIHEIHHLNVLLFVLINLLFPEPPNDEYLLKNNDLNQCWNSLIFATKDHIKNMTG